MGVLAVGNIPYDATEEQLIQICEEVGPVVSFRSPFLKTLTILMCWKLTFFYSLWFSIVVLLTSDFLTLNGMRWYTFTCRLVHFGHLAMSMF